MEQYRPETEELDWRDEAGWGSPLFGAATLYPTGTPGERRRFGDLWREESDALVRGVAHLLVNRISTLDAIGEAMAMGVETPEELAASLTGEARRLEAAVGLLRLVPAEREPLAEGMDLEELLTTVVALHAHHADVGSVPVRIDVSPEARVVHGVRTALVRALAVLTTAAKRAARAARAGVTVRTVADDDQVLVLLETDGAVGPLVGHAKAGADPRAVEILAEEGVAGGARYGLWLPGLTRSRREG